MGLSARGDHDRKAASVRYLFPSAVEAWFLAALPYVGAWFESLAIGSDRRHGDVYFKNEDHEQADQWFAREVEIDPNRETGYRFWGDDLVAQGRASEAKEQFINAVVADPYNQRSWMALSQWAKGQKIVLGNPRIVPPNQIEDKGKSQTNITIDPSTLQAGAKKRRHRCAVFLHPFQSRMAR